MAQGTTKRIQNSFLMTDFKSHIIFWLKLLVLYWIPGQEFFIVGGIVSKFEEKYLLSLKDNCSTKYNLKTNLRQLFPPSFKRRAIKVVTQVSN